MTAAFNDLGLPTRAEDIDDYQGRLKRRVRGASGDLTAKGPAEFVEADFSLAREPRGRTPIKERADDVRKHWWNFKEDTPITPTHKAFDQGDGAPFAGPTPLGAADGTDNSAHDRRSNVRLFLLAEDRFASVYVSAFEPLDPAKGDQYGPLADKARKRAIDILKVLATLDLPPVTTASEKTDTVRPPVGGSKGDPKRPTDGGTGGRPRGALPGESRPSYGAALLALRVSVKLADHDPALDVGGSGTVDARDATLIARQAAANLKSK